MRFISAAVAVFIASSSAKDTTLINQLSSLKSIVRETEEWDTNNMISAISARKEELEMDLKKENKSKKEVADELKYLLALVRDIESNDKTNAVQTLSSRKFSLVNLKDEGAEDGEEVVAEDGEEVVAEDGEEVVAEDGEEVVAEDGEEVVAEDGEEVVAKDKEEVVDTKEEETPKGDDKTKDGEEKAEEGSGMAGPIIGLVAIAVCAGGFCAYKKRQDSENEGGKKEDKKLFKKVFKGKTQKKATKEEMVPTFAVPSEEQV
jgi:hypothetical protein